MYNGSERKKANGKDILNKLTYKANCTGKYSMKNANRLVLKSTKNQQKDLI